MLIHLQWDGWVQRGGGAKKWAEVPQTAGGRWIVEGEGLFGREDGGRCWPVQDITCCTFGNALIPTTGLRGIKLSVMSEEQSRLWGGVLNGAKRIVNAAVGAPVTAAQEFNTVQFQKRETSFLADFWCFQRKTIPCSQCSSFSSAF